MSERCDDCDLPLATEADYNQESDDGCSHLCWRTWNDDHCASESIPSRRIDWRARAQAFERAAVHWAEAYARELARP